MDLESGGVIRDSEKSRNLCAWATHSLTAVVLYFQSFQYDLLEGQGQFWEDKVVHTKSSSAVNFGEHLLGFNARHHDV